MEVALVSSTSIRLKGKVVSFVVDPVSAKSKVQADAIVLLQDRATDALVEGSRLTMSGPGEYEISGVKITGIAGGESTSYFLTLDGVTVLLSKASTLKGKESLRDVDVTVLLADEVADQAALTTVTSEVALFYGEKAAENAKALGKEPQVMNKYVVTKDKLPAELEVVLLA